MPLPREAYEKYLAIKGDMLSCIFANVCNLTAGYGSNQWLRQYDVDAFDAHDRLTEPYRFNYTLDKRVEPALVLHTRLQRMAQLLKESGYEP